MLQLDPDEEIDPFNAAEVVKALEQACNVEISNSEVKKIHTVQDAIDITTRAISEQPAKWYKGKIKQ